MNGRIRITILLAIALLTTATAYPQSKTPETLEGRAIIITFDDGPRAWILPKILEFLKKEKIPAAFFVNCSKFEANEAQEDFVFGEYQEGHGVANHTYGHDNMPKYVQKKGMQWVMREEVERCSKMIRNVTGYEPRFFRPPFWAINDTIHAELTSRGYIVQRLDNASLDKEERVFRDVNTSDYVFHEKYLKNPSEATGALVVKIRKIIAARERDGVTIHVLTFHELPVSLEALKILVPEWRANDYQFQTLPWLYKVNGYGK